jgi:hypothetical protein
MQSGLPFHGERGYLEVVYRKKRLNETEKTKTGCQALPALSAGMHSRFAPLHSLLGICFRGGFNVNSSYTENLHFVILYRPTGAVFG